MTKKHSFIYDIVCVDDETQITSILSSFMDILYGETGFKMKTYNSPTIAMQEIKDGRLSAKVWLLDIMMPGAVNGADLAQEIRKRASAGKDKTFIYAYTAIASNAQIMEKYSKEHLFDGTYNKTKTPDTVLQSILSDHLGYSEDEAIDGDDDMLDFETLLNQSDIETEMQSNHVLVQEDLPVRIEDRLQKELITEFVLDDVDKLSNNTVVVQSESGSSPITEIEMELLEEQNSVLEQARTLIFETDDDKENKINAFEESIEKLFINTDKSYDSSPIEEKFEDIHPTPLVEEVKDKSYDFDSTDDDFDSTDDGFVVSAEDAEDKILSEDLFDKENIPFLEVQEPGREKPSYKDEGTFSEDEEVTTDETLNIPTNNKPQIKDDLFSSDLEEPPEGLLEVEMLDNKIELYETPVFPISWERGNVSEPSLSTSDAKNATAGQVVKFFEDDDVKESKPFFDQEKTETVTDKPLGTMLMVAVSVYSVVITIVSLILLVVILYS